MSDNKFAQRMAETGLVPEAFALAVLGGDWQSADKMLREVFPKGTPAETLREHQAYLMAIIEVTRWAAAGLGRLAGERECKEKSDGSNA